MPIYVPESAIFTNKSKQNQNVKFDRNMGDKKYEGEDR